MPACQRALTSVAAIRALCGGEVVGLEVSDHQSVVGADEQRVVVPAGVAQRVEHLRPHGLVDVQVLLRRDRA